jgi:peptidoglycan/xylan/chitin deacetylase (PgdA/CDA1 family)
LRIDVKFFLFRPRVSAVTDKLLLKFHGLGKPHSQVPEDERPYWIESELFHRLIESLDSIAKEFEIAIVPSFDDGNSSDLEIAAPVLAKYGMPGLFFPCTGRIGQKRYLDASDIRFLAQMGYGIGSHGVDHVRWTSLDGEALHREVHHSKQKLESILDAKVDSVAIPFGAYNRRVLSAVQSAAYSKIYTSDQGIVTGCSAILHRCSICEGDNDNPALLRKAIKRLRSPYFRLLTNAKIAVKSLR